VAFGPYNVGSKTVCQYTGPIQVAVATWLLVLRRLISGLYIAKVGKYNGILTFSAISLVLDI